MKKILLSTIAIISISTMAIAGGIQDMKGGNDQTGCGLGNTVITKPDSAIMYSLQNTTNQSASQSIAITLGTSGCKKTKFVMNERAQEFVASNMDQLAKEMAKGQGETIDTLAELLNIEDKATFAASLQQNYNSIYTSQKVEMNDVLDNISTTSL